MAADKPQHKAPYGMEPYDQGGPRDLGALSQKQQSNLNKFKIQTRVENEKYLRQHPEVECLMGGFLSDVLTKRPDNIQEFAAKYFIQPELNSAIEKSLEDRQNNIKQKNILQNIGSL